MGVDYYTCKNCGENFPDCGDCEYYEPESCKYCRHEDYEDDILLDKALGLLNMSRDDLVDKINKDSGKF